MTEPENWIQLNYDGNKISEDCGVQMYKKN